MQYGLHRHNFNGITTANKRHIHRYILKTGTSIPAFGGHIHYYQAVTSCDRGHIHCIYGRTSYNY